MSSTLNLTTFPDCVSSTVAESVLFSMPRKNFKWLSNKEQHDICLIGIQIDYYGYEIGSETSREKCIQQLLKYKINTTTRIH